MIYFDVSDMVVLEVFYILVGGTYDEIYDRSTKINSDLLHSTVLDTIKGLMENKYVELYHENYFLTPKGIHLCVTLFSK